MTLSVFTLSRLAEIPELSKGVIIEFLRKKGGIYIRHLVYYIIPRGNFFSNIKSFFYEILTLEEIKGEWEFEEVHNLDLFLPFCVFF